MGDVEKLLEKFAAGTLVRPCAELPNIVDLSRALATLVGAEGVEVTPGSIKLTKLIGRPDHLIFILADGLGMNIIDEMGVSTFLASHLKTELQTTFPSTTAVALTSIATGEWPNKHCVTGEWTHLPEIQGAGALLPFTKRLGGRSLTKSGIAIEQAFPLPPILRNASRDLLFLFPTQLVNSVSSTYISSYKTRLGYRTLPEAMEIIIARVREAEAPTYTYLYTPRLDLEAHRHGTGHSSVRAAILALDRDLERLASKSGGRHRIVLSADHGLLDAPVAARSLIRPSAELFDSLRFPPSGDARVMYFHVREGAEGEIRRMFRERFGERFFLISTEEAEQLGLFGPGPISPQTRDRIGDLMAISSGVDVLKYAPSETHAHLLSSAAYHSGLTPAEMRIPLVVA